MVVKVKNVAAAPPPPPPPRDDQVRSLQLAEYQFECGDRLYLDEQKYGSALVKFHDCRAIRESILGRYHYDTADVYNSIGYSYYVQQEHDKAMQAFRTWLRIERQLNATFKPKSGEDETVTTAESQLDDDLSVASSYQEYKDNKGKSSKQQQPQKTPKSTDWVNSPTIQRTAIQEILSKHKKLTSGQIERYGLNLSKSLARELEGDRFRKKGNFDHAMEKYKKAIDLEQQLPSKKQKQKSKLALKQQPDLSYCRIGNTITLAFLWRKLACLAGRRKKQQTLNFFMTVDDWNVLDRIDGFVADGANMNNSNSNLSINDSEQSSSAAPSTDPPGPPKHTINNPKLFVLEPVFELIQRGDMHHLKCNFEQSLRYYQKAFHTAPTLSTLRSKSPTPARPKVTKGFTPGAPTTTASPSSTSPKRPVPARGRATATPGNNRSRSISPVAQEPPAVSSRRTKSVDDQDENKRNTSYSFSAATGGIDGPTKVQRNQSKSGPTDVDTTYSFSASTGGLPSKDSNKVQKRDTSYSLSAASGEIQQDDAPVRRRPVKKQSPASSATSKRRGMAPPTRRSTPLNVVEEEKVYNDDKDYGNKNFEEYHEDDDYDDESAASSISDMQAKTTADGSSGDGTDLFLWEALELLQQTQTDMSHRLDELEKQQHQQQRRARKPGPGTQDQTEEKAEELAASADSALLDQVSKDILQQLDDRMNEFARDLIVKAAKAPAPLSQEEEKEEYSEGETPSRIKEPQLVSATPQQQQHLKELVQASAKMERGHFEQTINDLMDRFDYHGSEQVDSMEQLQKSLDTLHSGMTKYLADKLSEMESSLQDRLDEFQIQLEEAEFDDDFDDGDDEDEGDDINDNKEEEKKEYERPTQQVANVPNTVPNSSKQTLSGLSSHMARLRQIQQQLEDSEEDDSIMEHMD